MFLLYVGISLYVIFSVFLLVFVCLYTQWWSLTMNKDVSGSLIITNTGLQSYIFP